MSRRSRAQTTRAAVMLAVIFGPLLVRGSPAADDLVVIVGAASPERRIDGARLEEIFTGAEHRWPDGSDVVALNLPTEHPLRDLFDRAVLHMTPEEVGRYWVDQRVRGGPRPPRQVPDPVLAVRLVSKLRGAIAYVPRRFVDDSVRIVAHIRDGRVLAP